MRDSCTLGPCAASDGHAASCAEASGWAPPRIVVDAEWDRFNAQHPIPAEWVQFTEFAFREGARRVWL